jgi:hypothetical protein
MNENDMRDWKISQAPPPISPVIARGNYEPPKLKPANWDKWRYIVGHAKFNSSTAD